MNRKQFTCTEHDQTKWSCGESNGLTYHILKSEVFAIETEERWVYDCNTGENRLTKIGDPKTGITFEIKNPDFL